MIKSINVCNDANYSDPQAFAGLKEINFVYGANGSGKTTISRIIADQAAFARASVEWKDGRQIESLVYNIDFITRTFVPQMKGIFTLGEENADILAKIEATNALVSDHSTKIESLNATLGTSLIPGKRGELKTLRSAFEEQCWQIKLRHDDHFKGAFDGLRNNKARFCDRVLESTSSGDQLPDFEALKTRAATLYDSELGHLDRIAVPSFLGLQSYESNAILAKKIVGKEDVDVAGLILRVGNSDWVKSGLAFLEQSDEQCPFCQQSITSNLSKQLNEFFDETYLADMAALNSLAENYAALSGTILARLEGLLETDQKHFDRPAFQAQFDRFKSRIEANRRLVETKRESPSAIVTLETTEEIAAALLAVVAEANVAIDKHNAMVANHANEKRKLTSEIWRFILEEDNVPIKNYVDARTALDKAVGSLVESIADREEARRSAKAELANLEKSVTSVQPTVNEINATLESFGFTGFKLATSGDRDHLYEIIREDGSAAMATLSEGEKSFITFLYFYNLIKGSHVESGVTAERIIVFDDPVSSLDSDVLFMVSALIKRFLSEAKNGAGLVKQVFVLTHNVYFHKEVSFDPKSRKYPMNHRTHWIVRKANNASVLESYDYNPIKTSYELLWSEVKNPTRSPLTIQNTLRRILENYFTILGNRNPEKIIEKFEGKDKQICASLYSWINDGSHSTHDDCYVAPHDGQVTSYLDVFKRIFEVTGHGAHYEMMSGEDGQSDLETVGITAVVETVI